jgi:hypothetical protein
MNRKDAIKLTEGTQVISNNWYYADNNPTHQYTDNAGIINGWLLTQRNDNQFKELFGKCTFATNEWEFYTRCWVREFQGETFLIHSSEKGSSYEITNQQTWEAFSKDEKIGKIIIAFTEDLVQKMRALEINQDNIAKWGELEKSP